MRSLYGDGARVPAGRVLREYRRALIPLAIALIGNALMLAGVVLPLSQRVTANEVRAERAAREQAAAAGELQQAEAVKESKARAATDLESFYAKTLPQDVAAARRMTHLQLQQKAREHGVQFRRGATSEDELRDSTLNRLTVAMTLLGEYHDIRMLIDELERSADFMIIDNLVLTEGSEANAPLSVALDVSTYFRRSSAPTVLPRSNGR
ncbi:MAG: type 4a pilus biogenesis protein PilO [Acidobacteriota bacterium]